MHRQKEQDKHMDILKDTQRGRCNFVRAKKIYMQESTNSKHKGDTQRITFTPGHKENFQKALVPA